MKSYFNEEQRMILEYWDIYTEIDDKCNLSVTCTDLSTVVVSFHENRYFLCGQIRLL